MNVRTLIGLILAFASVACAHVDAPPRPDANEPRTLILISLDGFRADYLDRGLTPVLSKMAREGVRAAAMRPSFPSVTFPNHYSIVTGLRPDRHGIVNNYMEDAAIPGEVFKLSDRDVLADPRWWNGGEPIWVAAERAGLKAATLFWPGSETEIHGVRPRDWTPYDKTMDYADRVDRVLMWLGRARKTRPRFVTLYFEAVDSQGHMAGPDSAAVNGALAQVDAALGRLADGVRERHMDQVVDIIVVSDHGMAATAAERTVDLDEIVDPQAVQFRWLGRAFAGLEAAPGRSQTVEATVLGKHDHFECWRKGEMPARFHFGTSSRIPPIFCLADVGWILVSRSHPDGYPVAGGAHGYDPAAPEMAGLFVAHGPSFRSGVTVPAFDNVDVYPLMRRILGLPPAANDGALGSLQQALAE